MTRFPIVTADKGELRKADDNEVVDVLPRGGSTHPFFSFSYSYTEWSTSGGRTQVKSRPTRLENGRLVSESFEGELPANAYQQQMRQAQEQLLGPMRALMQPFSWFLPAWRKPFDRD